MLCTLDLLQRKDAENYIMDKVKPYSLKRFCATDVTTLHKALKDKRVVKHMASN